MRLEVEILGRIVSPVKELIDESWGEVVSEIMFDEGYAEGLVGLEDFSHAIVIYFMHLATDKGRIKVRRRPREEMICYLWGHSCKALKEGQIRLA